LRQRDQQITLNWSKAVDPLGGLLTYEVHFFGPGVDTTFSTPDTMATFSVGPIEILSTYVLTGSVTNGMARTATTNSASFRAASTFTGVEESSIDAPTLCGLQQNYPNPFNPATKIRYTVGAASGQSQVAREVSLTVYDMLGRDVAVLVNGKVAPGSHTVDFDASGLASGVYYYRLQVYPQSVTFGRESEGGASGFVESKKLVVLK